MDIKPIETIYNGYRFRSRLEARWAVFFDKAGIPYEYELEGYRLQDGSAYLPDFYLPWFNAYVEIKPNGIAGTLLEKAMLKCALLSVGQKSISLLCIGDPLDSQVWIYCVERNEGDEGVGYPVWEKACFVEGAELRMHVLDDYACGGATKHWINIAVGPWEALSNKDYLSLGQKDANLIQLARMSDCRQSFLHAAEAARQARFEHGERGAPAYG